MLRTTAIQLPPRRPYHLSSMRRFNSSSTKSPQYHPKVRALPFSLSPSEAATRVPYPQLLSQLLKVENFIQNLLRKGRIDWKTPLQFVPTETIAIYLPSWFIDIDARVSNPNRQSKQAMLDVAIPQAFLPGHSLDPLCRMSMREVCERNLIQQAMPFTEDMSKQYDKDIACLPYTLTPLLIDKAFAELAGDKLEATDYMVAAYPILIPAYLFEYSFKFHQGTVQTFAVAEAASQEGGTIYVKNIIEELSALSEASDLPMFQNLEEYVPEFEIQPPGADTFLSIYNGAMPSKLQEDLSEQLNSLLSKPKDSLRRYAQFEKTRRSGANIDFDDLRIREWTEEEVQLTNKYMDAKSVFRSITQLNDLLTVSGAMGIDNIEQTRATTDETKPSWLKEWERQQQVSGGVSKDQK